MFKTFFTNFSYHKKLMNNKLNQLINNFKWEKYQSFVNSLMFLIKN
jgi:hypothetical protein